MSLEKTGLADMFSPGLDLFSICSPNSSNLMPFVFPRFSNSSKAGKSVEPFATTNFPQRLREICFPHSTLSTGRCHPE